MNIWYADIPFNYDVVALVVQCATISYLAPVEQVKWVAIRNMPINTFASGIIRDKLTHNFQMGKLYLQTNQ